MLAGLKQTIWNCPLIDNHAHNVLRPQQLLAANLLTISTEAEGESLKDARFSLPHLRISKQLRELYGLDSAATWEDICKRRLELIAADPTALFKKCFSRIQTILIDDGLDSGANVQPYNWHDQFTTSKCKRIVRIEAVAADVLTSMWQHDKLPAGSAMADEEACSLAWVDFIARFEQAIISAIRNPEVVGFKSIVAYRTGLDVQTGTDSKVSERGLRSFRNFLAEAVPRKFRVEAKGLNDCLVISTCKLISAAIGRRRKPFQFHCGLGDNSMSLLHSDPAYLQPLIKAFVSVPFVLLHSAYPFTRNAGYLATVYSNVYLDLGEVFPMVARHGQESIIRQALEVTPWSKLLMSTDAHFVPEGYWLADLQIREVFDTVFCELVQKSALGEEHASHAVKDIFFNNSNNLYDLGLVAHVADSALADPDLKNLAIRAPRTTAKGGPYDPGALSDFLSDRTTEYFIVSWVDFLGNVRSRWLPTAEFEELISSGRRISISTGNLGTLANDSFTPAVRPIGQILVEPDLKSLRPMQQHPPLPPMASVFAGFRDESGTPLYLCPRSETARAADLFTKEFGIHLLIGFEIEITFLKKSLPSADSSSTLEHFTPLDQHNWGSLTDVQYAGALPFVLEVVKALGEMGIALQYFHSEAAAGQYEFVLPPMPSLQAIDTLYQARNCIQQVAATSTTGSLRATCHPLPFPGIGTAAHAHISLNHPDIESAELDQINDSFVAAILENLSALCAFTMPQAISYGRVVADGWTGGEFVGWGTENREVPMRKVKGSVQRWEVRCLDGLANMYLALGAILMVGLKGARDKRALKWKDCQENPSLMTDEQLRECGMETRMPKSLDEALDALEKSDDVKGAMSPGLVEHYLTMKRSEQEMLSAMSEEERRNFFITRY